MPPDLWIDLAGWVGVAALLAAYALVSTRRLEGDSPLYQALNALGSLLLIVNSGYYRALPSVGINVAWIGIALYALARYRRRRRDVTIQPHPTPSGFAATPSPLLTEGQEMGGGAAAGGGEG